MIKFTSILKETRRKNREVISLYGLSPNEINILVVLDSGEADTAKEISQIFEISKSLVCRSVESPIKKNYIDSKKDEKDKRISHLALREEAKNIINILKINRVKTEEILFDGIDEESLIIFNKVLDKMKENLL